MIMTILVIIGAAVLLFKITWLMLRLFFHIVRSLFAEDPAEYMQSVKFDVPCTYESARRRDEMEACKDINAMAGVFMTHEIFKDK